MGLVKKLSSGGKLLLNRLGQNYFPMMVSFLVTNRCNFRCSYCRFYERDQKDPQLSKVLKLVEELISLGTQRISFAGGEPLLREDLGEILQFTKKLGASVSIVSNGSLVAKNLDLLQVIDDVCISFDGPEEIMDANRTPGSYRQAVQACKILQKESIPFHLNCVLTKNNAFPETVRYTLDFAKEHGSRAAFFIMHEVAEISGEVNSLKASNSALKECLIEVVKACQKGEPVIFSKRAYERASLWQDFSNFRIMEKGTDLDRFPSCWAGRYYAVVDTDGIIYPCCLWMGEFAGENAYKVGAWRAFMKAGQHQCHYCAQPAWIDYNQFFSLEPSVLWHVFKNGNV